MIQVADLGSDIRAVVAEIGAQDELVQQLEGAAKVAGQKRLAAAFARLQDLQARLPNVPHTFADLVLDADPNEYFAARLIDAVLTTAGPRTDHISRH